MNLIQIQIDLKQKFFCWKDFRQKTESGGKNVPPSAWNRADNYFSTVLKPNNLPVLVFQYDNPANKSLKQGPMR